MKIITTTPPAKGLSLGLVPYGQIVTLPVNDSYYMVANRTDGTGGRCLLILSTGSIRQVPQDTQVIPVDAALIVGELPECLR